MHAADGGTNLVGSKSRFVGGGCNDWRGDSERLTRKPYLLEQGETISTQLAKTSLNLVDPETASQLIKDSPCIASCDQRVPCNGKRGDALSILRQVHVAAVPADGARQSAGTNDCPSRCEKLQLPLCLAPERSCGTQRRSY